MPDDVVQIAHFSDTLCIWAYVSPDPCGRV